MIQALAKKKMLLILLV